MSVGEELALSAARAAVRCPSLEGCVVLSGEWILRPDFGGGMTLKPYTERSCVRLFWYLSQGEVQMSAVAHNAVKG